MYLGCWLKVSHHETVQANLANMLPLVHDTETFHRYGFVVAINGQ